MNANTDISEISRYIGIWSPTLLIGLVIAFVGAITFYTGFTRKTDNKFIVMTSVVLFLAGALMCIGLIPEDVIFYRYIEKQYYILLNTLRLQIFTFGGIIMLMYALIFGFTKKMHNIYSDVILKTASVISGIMAELLALLMIGYSILGFINYMNI